MDRVYLQEAFHAMELLEEEDFSFRNDNASVKEILDFKKEDLMNDDLDIVDPEAESEEDIEDTYIGKVILECEVCHSPIFKDVAEVVVDETSDLANIEDECPICHSNDGFTIIGQVCPFEAEAELKVEVEDKDVEDEDDEEEIEESLTEDLDPELEDKLDAIETAVADVAEAVDEVAAEVVDEESEEEVADDLDVDDEIDADVDVEVEDDLGLDADAEEKESEEEFEEAKVCEKCGENPCKCNKEIREGFEKVDLEMEDKIIHVSEEEKEPIPDAEMVEPVTDELASEIMAPTDIEVEEPIEAPIEDAPIEEPVEEPIEEPVEEEPDFEESLKSESQTAINEECEDKMIDYTIEDFSEAEFNKLGESYLKKVYENVNSFRADSVSEEGGKLVVEGIIKFNSGKEKATKFIFESKDATANGKVRFVGENAQICRGRKAFTLSGSMNEGRFMAESLSYNYQVNSNRINGTVRVDG